MCTGETLQFLWDHYWNLTMISVFEWAQETAIIFQEAKVKAS